ncbi:MAG: hypothetical protein WBQ94_21345 [Terracidiphilus sp.]
MKMTPKSSHVANAEGDEDEGRYCVVVRYEVAENGMNKDTSRAGWVIPETCESSPHELDDSSLIQTERSAFSFRRAGLVSQEFFDAGRGAVDLAVWRRSRQHRRTEYAELTRAAQIVLGTQYSSIREL